MGRPTNNSNSRHPRNGERRSFSSQSSSSRSSSNRPASAGSSSSRPSFGKPSSSRNSSRPSFGKSSYGKPKGGFDKGRKSFRRDDTSSFIPLSKEFTETKQPHLFQEGRSFLTKNPYPGKLFFDMEREHRLKGSVYREVDPKRSKFVAALAKGLQQTGMSEGSIVLYLGASHGYTPSFFSDIIGGKEAKSGMLFCLDFAPRVVRDLYFVCEQRPNMAPILASASKIEDYKDLIPEVDVVFQDIAQRDQLGIFLKNCDAFLKQGGFGMVTIKARSIDVTATPKDIFKKLRIELEENPNYTVIDYRELDPFEMDHAFFVVRKK